MEYNYEATQNTYEVTVKASDGLASDTVAVTISLTDANEKPAKPAKPTLAAVSGSSTTVDASWVKPGLNGGPEITGYDLQYREGATGTWTDFSHSSTAVTTTITGLTGDTEYQVQVRAKNVETDSDWSDASDAVSTNADTPATCTLNMGDLWCGVLTVGAINNHQDGFLGTTGGLSDTMASVGTSNYTIDAVSVDNSNATDPENLLFSLTGGLTAVHTAKLVLHVGSDTFAFSAAQYFGANDSYQWTSSGLDWSSVSTLTLRLRAPNNAPVFAAATDTRAVEENSAAGTTVGAAVTATDADSGDTLEYSLEGTDATSFAIGSASGQITTIAGEDYNYEAAKNTYSVTVKASDGLASDTIDVTISLTDADEKPARAGQADAGGGLGLVDEPGGELDEAGPERRPRDHRLRPAVPRGHDGQLGGLHARRHRRHGDDHRADGEHGVPGARAGKERAGGQRLVGRVGHGEHERGDACADYQHGGGELDAGAGDRHLRGGRGDPLHGDLQRGGGRDRGSGFQVCARQLGRRAGRRRGVRVRERHDRAGLRLHRGVDRRGRRRHFPVRRKTTSTTRTAR